MRGGSNSKQKTENISCHDGHGVNFVKGIMDIIIRLADINKKIGMGVGYIALGRDSKW